MLWAKRDRQGQLQPEQLTGEGGAGGGADRPGHSTHPEQATGCVGKETLACFGSSNTY